MARRKSGNYTVRRPLEIGAVLSGCETRTLALLGAYGSAVGEAFQLRDDLLGIFGPEPVTGKPSGGDLSEHKATSVVVAAHQMADATIRRQLAELMSSDDIDDAAITRWRTLIVATGAVEWIEDMIAERVALARDHVHDTVSTRRCGRRWSIWLPCARCVLHDGRKVRSTSVIRTVGGRADHIVVVGAGLAGLSAALHLAGRGRQVTVVERDAVPGGRVGRVDIRGYRLDTGPTVLTMPDIIDDAFAAVGESRKSWLDLLPVDPAYHATFADGSELDVHSDAGRMAASVEAFAGADQAAGYLKLRDWLTRLYRTEFDGFIAANFDSPLSLLTPQLARLAALGGFRRWARVVERFIGDERLRRVFTFQSLYAGVPPHRALAVYAVIAYMDTVAGVYFPRGGMRALPDALAGAAADAGVRFEYSATVTTLERSG